MAKHDVILVAVDGSDDADKAFQESLELVKHHEAKLVIGHVIDSNSFSLVTPYYDKLWEDAKEGANRLLEEYVQKAKDYGLTDIETAVEYGSPRRTIVKDIAPKYNVDLIVVGATGLNAVERVLLGSVSEGITRYAKCNVYVVK